MKIVGQGLVRRHPLWLLSCGFFLLVTLSRNIGRYQFMDGVTHATIARNYIVENRSFWNPLFSYVGPIYLNEVHLPLALWLESRFFLIAGWSNEAILLWGVLWGLGILWGMIIIWKAFSPKIQKESTWWPLLLSSIVPLFSWGIANNILEIPMTGFVVWAVVCLVKGAEACGIRFFFLGLAAGVLVWLGHLSKEFIALFPLVTPFILFISDWPRFRSRILVVWIFELFGFSAAALVTYQWGGKDMTDFLRRNWSLQVSDEFRCLKSYFTQCEFFTIRRLSQELSPALLLVLIVAWVFRKEVTKINARTINARASLITLWVGLSGSLPLLLGDKQFERYLVPSIPFFILSLALVSYPWACELEMWVRGKTKVERYIRIMGMCLGVVGIVGFTFFPGIIVERNSDFDHDFVAQDISIEPGSSAALCSPEDFHYWVLLGLMQLKYGVQLYSYVETKLPDYLIVNETLTNCRIPKECESISRDKPHIFRVYRCKKSQVSSDTPSPIR